MDSKCLLWWLLCAALVFVASSESVDYFPSSDSLLEDTRGSSLSPNCSSAFQRFSEAAVNFTRCTVQFARPVRLCMQCIEHYRAAEEAYDNLKAQASECQRYFFSSDTLGVVDVIHNNARNLWIKSFCQNCFSNGNLTATFFELTKEFDFCIEHSNQSVRSAMNGTCETCRPIFVNLTSAYHKFVAGRDEFDVSGVICMDVQDSMNASVVRWARLECSVGFDASVGVLNILTALTVGATPALFYLFARNVAKMEDVKLVRPKRKSTVLPPPPPEERSDQ